MTLPTCRGAGLSITPPGVMPAVPIRLEFWIGRGFVCRLTRLRFSTTTFLSLGRASITRPCLPRSLPLRMWTRSPFLILMVWAISEHLRRQGNDLHEVLLAQLARDRPEDAGAARVALVVDDHGGVLVERDRRAVLATVRLLRAHDDGLHDLALLHGALRRGEFDGADDDVADARVAAVRPALHADAQELAGAGVVGHAQSGLLLDHRRPSEQVVLTGCEKPAAQGRREGA